MGKDKIHESFFSMRVTEKEKIKVEEVAKKLGYSIPEFLRFIIVDTKVNGIKKLNLDTGYSKNLSSSVNSRISPELVNTLDSIKSKYQDDQGLGHITRSRFMRSLVKNKIHQLETQGAIWEETIF